MSQDETRNEQGRNGKGQELPDTARAEQDSLAQAAGQAPMPDMSACLEKFSRTFEASAKRWELIVYPSLLAFIVLAAYGFYLIYSLTTDVDRITGQMELISKNMLTISDTMKTVSGTMLVVSKSMNSMDTEIKVISSTMSDQLLTMERIAGTMDTMNGSMLHMSAVMGQMRFDTALMGYNMQNATGPMRFMNQFMPW